MKRENIAALGVLLLALALRLGRLPFQPLWADEGYSVYFAGLDMWSLIQATAADIHPPLYYFLLKGWMALFGAGDFGLRLLSVCLGVATVAFGYALAARLAGPRVAVLASLLLAVSPFHVYYSQEVRMYALACLLAVASTLFMRRVLDGWLPAEENADAAAPSSVNGGLLALVLYIITTTLALYSLYYAVFIPVAQTLFALAVLGRRWRLVARWLALQGVLVVLYLPWATLAFDALTRYVAGKVAIESYAALDPLTFAMQVFAALALGVPSAGRAWLSLGALPVIGLAVLGALGLPRGNDDEGGGKRASRDARLLAATLVLAPVVLGYLVNLLWPFSPTGFQRLFLFCLPFFTILVALGVLRLIPALTDLASRRGAATAKDRYAGLVIGVLAAIGLVAGLLTLADFYLTPRYVRDDYRPLVSRMAQLGSPDDAVVALYPWQLGFVRSYYIGALPDLYFVERAAEWADYPAVMRQDLDRLGAEHGRLWFASFETAGRLLESAITDYLGSAAFPGVNTWFGDHRLLLYSFGRASSVRRHVVVEGVGVLEDVSVSMTPVRSGQDCVRVALKWENALPPPGVQVALRLADEGGRIWAHWDSPVTAASVAGRTAEDRHALAISSMTPPGAYRLLLSLYDAGANRTLSLASATSEALGGEIELAKVVVVRGDYRPPLAALALPHARYVQFADAPALVGYSVPASLRPGHRVVMDFYWQATADLDDDPVLFVQVRDLTNKVWGLYEGQPVAPQYPPTRWDVGETLWGQVQVLLAPDAPSGDYRVVVGWLKAGSKQRMAVIGGGDEVVVASVRVLARAHTMTLPRPETSLDVRVGEAMQLLGYDGDLNSARPGASLTLTLHWRALARMDASYKVFVHLVDENGRLAAQHDSEPGEGELPTTSWLPGEAVADRHTLDLPANLPAGTYTVAAGVYDAVSRARVPVRAAGAQPGRDVIELGTIRIAGR